MLRKENEAVPEGKRAMAPSASKKNSGLANPRLRVYIEFEISLRRVGH